MAVKRMLLGLAAGAGLMYLFDPDSGKDRRQRLMDRANGTKFRFEDRVNGASDVVQGEYMEMATANSNARRSRATARDDRDASGSLDGEGVIASSSE